MRFGALVVAIVVAVCPIAAALAAGGDNGKTEFEKALKYSKAGEWEAALPYFEKAYTLSGKRASTILALAQCERELKMFDAAIGHFKEYLASKPTPKDSAAIQETIGLLEDLKAAAERKALAEQQKAAPPAQEKPKTDPAPAVTTKTQPPPAIATNPEPQPKQNVELTPTAKTQPPPKDDDDGFVGSPIFWVATAAVVVGGGIALGVALSGDSGGPTLYGGTTGIVLQKLEDER